MTLSELDFARFGVVTAKVKIDAIERVAKVLQSFESLGAELLIVRVPASRLDVVQALEQAGARLCDALVYYARKARAADDGFIQNLGPFQYRFAHVGDAQAVGALAARTFKGYFGHYHADPRIDPMQADAVYASWAERSCAIAGVADRVILCETIDAVLIGFATVTEEPASKSVEGVLFGVDPEYQGRGIYRDLIRNTVGYARGVGASRVIVSTQVTNMAVQRVWIREAFEPSDYLFTLHLWRDRVSDASL